MVVARKLRSSDVLAALADLLARRGPPADNGPEFVANTVQARLRQVGVKTLNITPASQWENGYNESFNGTLPNELLNGEIFYTLAEARVLIKAGRRHYNTARPHSSVGYRPPETATPPCPPSGFDSLPTGGHGGGGTNALTSNPNHSGGNHSRRSGHVCQLRKLR